MGYIYMLTSPKGKIYIGQTIRPIKKRLEEHRLGQSSGCRGIYNAIKKHGWENFEKDWYYCPDEDLNKHEELMVEVLGTLSPYGYNLREGGGNYGKVSEESKQKNREAHIGKTPSETTKNKISEALRGEKCYMFGIPKCEESKQKNREANSGKNHPMYGKTGENHYNYGKTHTEETKQKCREANMGEKNPNYGKIGDKNHKSKRIYQYDLDGIFIDSFGSCREAARYLNKSMGSIGACARGNPRYKTAYNFKWSYIMDIFI
jgi:group I intron endonuclease